MCKVVNASCYIIFLLIKNEKKETYKDFENNESKDKVNFELYKDNLTNTIVEDSERNYNTVSIGDSIIAIFVQISQ